MSGDKAAGVLFAGLMGGDPRALGRALSIVETGGADALTLLALCDGLLAERAANGLPRAPRIGVTGPPGAGKSTLIDALVRRLRAAGQTVGVLAIDPSSPYTGGALLGDRIRMSGFTGDAGVTIRSMASRGELGGLARGAAAACRVLEAAGRETILIETVGVGQDEVAVAELADAVVLVLAPGMGDGVQSLKAGVMEIADLYAVNKADTPGAAELEAEILALQGLAPPAAEGVWVPPVVRTVASTGEGVDALLAGLARRAERARPLRPAPGWAAPAPAAPATLDHLGIAVESIAAARQIYEALGLSVEPVEELADEGVRTAMLDLGPSRIELLEPLGAETPVGRFLARRGAGLHHVALRVSGLDARFATLRAAGVRLASDAIRVGAGGHRYFFVHPESACGVLLELVGAADEGLAEQALVGEGLAGEGASAGEGAPPETEVACVSS